MQEIRARRSLEKEFKSKLDECEKYEKSVKTGDKYILDRVDMVKDQSKTLGAWKTAVKDMARKRDAILNSMEYINNVDVLQEIKTSCPFETFVSKASHILQYLSERKASWDRLLLESQNEITKMETQVSEHKENKRKRAGEEEEVKCLKKDADSYYSQVKSIKGMRFSGRNPAKIVENRFQEVVEYEKNIKTILEEIEVIEITLGIKGKYSKPVEGHLKECAVVKAMLSRKREQFQQSAQSRQSESESHMTNASKGQITIHRNEESGQGKREIKPNSRYVAP